MVLVTDKQIAMHPGTKEKLDLMIHRMEKKKFDNCLIIDGKEGFGKTTLATQFCYYVSYETGRPFSVDNVYFRVKEMLEVMQKTDRGIFLLDEAELDLMSEQRGAMQRYFIQMLMAARKKNHFIVVIMPTIKKLKQYVVERAIGFVRVYSTDGLSRGTYAYYKEESKNLMFENFLRTRRMDYRKYYTFNATFPDTYGKIIDEEEYDKKKDSAIASIGTEEKMTARTKKLIEFEYRLRLAIEKGFLNVTGRDLAKILGTTERTVCSWKDYPDKYDFLEDVNIEM